MIDMEREDVTRLVYRALARHGIQGEELEALTRSLSTELGDALAVAGVTEDALLDTELEWGITYPVIHRNGLKGVGYHSTGLSRDYAEEMRDAHVEGAQRGPVRYGGPAEVVKRVHGPWRVDE